MLSNLTTHKTSKNDFDEAPQRKLMSISEVKRRTSLGRTSVYKAIRQGDLAVVKFGSRTLIPLQALDDWIASLPRSEAK